MELTNEFPKRIRFVDFLWQEEVKEKNNFFKVKFLAIIIRAVVCQIWGIFRGGGDGFGEVFIIGECLFQSFPVVVAWLPGRLAANKILVYLPLWPQRLKKP